MSKGPSSLDDSGEELTEDKTIEPTRQDEQHQVLHVSNATGAAAARPDGLPPSSSVNNNGGRAVLEEQADDDAKDDSSTSRSAAGSSMENNNDMGAAPAAGLPDVVVMDDGVEHNDEQQDDGMIHGADLREHDVLLGRGTGPNEYPGNVSYRNLVLAVLKKSCGLGGHTAETGGESASSSEQQRISHFPDEKIVLARTIVQMIKARGGRFLERPPDIPANSTAPPSYREVDDDVAIEKTKQSFRHQMRSIERASPMLNKNKQKRGGGDEEESTPTKRGRLVPEQSTARGGDDLPILSSGYPLPFPNHGHGGGELGLSSSARDENLVQHWLSLVEGVGGSNQTLLPSSSLDRQRLMSSFLAPHYSLAPSYYHNDHILQQIALLSLPRSSPGNTIHDTGEQHEYGGSILHSAVARAFPAGHQQQSQAAAAAAAGAVQGSLLDSAIPSALFGRSSYYHSPQATWEQAQQRLLEQQEQTGRLPHQQLQATPTPEDHLAIYLAALQQRRNFR